MQRAVITRCFCTWQGHQLITCVKPITNNTRLLSSFKTALRRCTRINPPCALEIIPGMYFGSKRKVYQRAVDSLAVDPLRAEDAHIQMHMKVEKIVVSLGYTDNAIQLLESKDPRAIQARTPRFNAQLGRFLKPNEHKIFIGINKLFHELPNSSLTKTVMKGLNASDQGIQIADKWNSFKNPVAIRLDAKRFDQHISVLLLKFEHSVYLSLFKRHCTTDEINLLRKLLRWQLTNRCYGRAKDGYVKYTLHGNRMSGDMNTGLGNVIIMCGLMFLFIQNVSTMLVAASLATPANIHIELVNNGDDCSLIVEREYLDTVETALSPFFLTYGIEMELEGRAIVLEKLKFCQCHPVWTPDGYRMVRDVRTAMVKDSITILPIRNQADFDAYRGATMGCGLALTSGIPIAQAWYLAIGRGTGSTRSVSYNCGADYLAHGMDDKISVIHEQTRSSFDLAFDCPPDLQLAIEERLTNYVFHYYEVKTGENDGQVGDSQVW